MNSNKPKGLEKEERSCYVCGRTNHLAKDCYFKKTAPYAPRNNPNPRGQRAQVKMLMDGDNYVKPSFRYKTSLINLTYENKDWWLDSDANIHVYFDGEFLKLIRNQVEEV